MVLNYKFIGVLLMFFIQIGIAQEKPLEVDKEVDAIVKNIDTIKTEYEKTYRLTGLAGKYKYAKRSRKFINKAIAIAKQSNNPELLAVSHYSLGNYFYFNLQLDSSSVALVKAKEYIKEEKLPLVYASILTTESGIYKKKGDVKRSIVIKLEARSILEKVDTLTLSAGDKYKYKGKSLVLDNSLANLYNQMEDYAMALQYYDAAFQSAMKIGAKINAGAILSNKGDMLLNMGSYTEALKMFEKGKTLKVEANAPLPLIASSNSNIGYAYTGLNNYEKAEISFNNAISVFENENSLSRQIYAYIGRGVLYNRLQKYQLAQQDCEKAKDIAIKQNDLESKLKSCKCLYVAYKELGDYQKAIENQELFIAAKDSIFNKKNIKKLAQLEMQYNFDKKQELQNIENLANEKERKLYLWLAFIGFILASTLAFFFYRNRKQKIILAKQKVLLETAVDEKNILLRETHHRVKNSFQIVSSLLYLQSENMEDKEAALAVKEAQNRVKSMVLIHQKLYSKDQLIGINTQEYITDLTRDIVDNQAVGIKNLVTSINADSYVLSVDTITPIGLIINELITNVVKHAFTGGSSEPKLNVTFKKVNDYFLLQIEDNGVGISEEFSESSFGIKLIKSLSKKLKATLTFENDNGTLALVKIYKFEEVL